MSAIVSYCKFWMVAPFSMMARTMRTKCVSGSPSPIYCAQTGMPANGNMKPDNRMLGRKNIIDSCIACSWFCTMVENV